MYVYNTSDINRFWLYVNKTDTCWLWTGALTAEEGHGAFWVGGRQEIASRASYIIEHGSIPDGKYILHTCDNPPCVNPEHLYAGSAWDNMQDKLKRGRANSPKGQQHYKTHLTDEDVIQIRSMRKYVYISPETIGLTYGISRQSVNDILEGRTWKHVSIESTIEVVRYAK